MFLSAQKETYRISSPDFSPYKERPSTPADTVEIPVKPTKHGLLSD